MERGKSLGSWTGRGEGMMHSDTIWKNQSVEV